MRSEISYHFVEVLKACCGQVDGVTFFRAIVFATPFSEVAPDAGV